MHGRRMALVSKGLVLAILAAGVAFAAPAHAQNAARAAVPADSGRATAPWYERFTFGTETGESVNAWTPRGEPRASLRVAPQSRWGVSFGIDGASSALNDRRTGRPAAGAFYDLSPQVRVGGQVVLPERSRNAVEDRIDPRGSQPGVRVESAFRF